jgi:hypothetical protein
MIALLEQLYEYRRLLGRCGSDDGLEMGEIQQLAALDAQLAASLDQPRPRDVIAVVRGASSDDRVKLVDLCHTTMTIAACPFLDIGAKLDVMIDDEERALSYRFKARVLRFELDGSGNRITLELVGAPLLLRRRQRTAELVAHAA